MGRRDKIVLENVLVTGVAAEGKALAQVDGKVLFVPGGIPGDVLRVQVTRKRKAFMEGHILEVLNPSPDRIPPVCRHFGDCGGCKWQHLPYPLQLKYKQQQVWDQLTRIGKLTLPQCGPILGSEKVFEYRNKLEFTFSCKRWLTRDEVEDCSLVAPQERPALGFHITGLFDKVLDIEHCHLQAQPSNAIRLALKQYALDHGLSFFNLREQTGLLRNVTVRNNQKGQFMVTVVFSQPEPEEREAVAVREGILNHLADKFPEITSLHYVINNKRNDSYADLPVVCYRGEEALYDGMEDLVFKIGPKSFYQTNPAQALRLYQVVRDFAGLTGKELVYDLYTGTGTIALFLARQAARVVGIEYVPEAIEDAKHNAALNGIGNTAFFAGDMKDLLTPAFLARQGRPEVIVLDPPRAGVHPSVIDVLIEAAAPRLVYVSCNPATQARDLQLLSDYYTIEAVQPVDMFPHTHHVENVVLAVHK